MADEGRERLMKSYSGSDFRARRRVEVDALYEMNEEWALPDFLKLIKDTADAIPEASRDNARVILGEYDNGTLKISFHRSETDDEYASRIRKTEAWADSEIAKERRTYEILSIKYGSAPPSVSDGE
jgi:hypothetical protein